MSFLDLILEILDSSDLKKYLKMSTVTKPTLSFFGATGGCSGNALAHALRNGYTASALARTPQKLIDALEKEHQIPTATISSNLTIVKGSVSDISAIKETLAPKGVPASIIVTGIGAAPTFTWNPLSPFVMDQPTICGDASVAMLTALRELRREGVIAEGQKPFVCVVSTTGISTIHDDVPFVLKPLYHVLLKVPHMDKVNQERNYALATNETGSDAPIDNFCFVRPTLLADGKPKGVEAVKAGWGRHPDAALSAVDGDGPGPACGYLINRSDVGAWIFENAVRNPEKWKGKCVSLAYA